MIDISNETLESKNIPCKHRFFIDQAFICELNNTATFLDKKHIFCNLAVINNPLVCIKGKLLS